jgi:DNA-binding GntR family transcriptional regulator
MPSSLADQAYESLKQAILHCDLEPGLHVAQSQLADKYELSITPTREALKRLEQEGYVQSVPRFGYLVSPISPVDVSEIYELRLILESAAVRLAAQRITPRQTAPLREQAELTYTYQEPQSYRIFLNMNREFHAQIALTSGNKRLADTIAKLLDDMTRIFHLGLDLRDSAQEMRVEHLNLVDALAKHNPEEAEIIIREQIVRSRERVLQMLRDRFQTNLFDSERSSINRV